MGQAFRETQTPHLSNSFDQVELNCPGFNWLIKLLVGVYKLAPIG
jgi:hypothetical protein